MRAKPDEDRPYLNDLNSILLWGDKSAPVHYPRLFQELTQRGGGSQNPSGLLAPILAHGEECLTRPVPVEQRYWTFRIQFVVRGWG